jgi:hypothetical protein
MKYHCYAPRTWVAQRETCVEVTREVVREVNAQHPADIDEPPRDPGKSLEGLLHHQKVLADPSGSIQITVEDLSFIDQKNGA